MPNSNWLLGAKAVAYPGEGASGIDFAGQWQRKTLSKWSHATKRDMVVVASRIVGVPGVEFVGLISAEMQTNIGFAAGVSSASREPDAARALVRYLTTSSAEPVLRKAGIEPFVG